MCKQVARLEVSCLVSGWYPRGGKSGAVCRRSRSARTSFSFTHRAAPKPVERLFHAAAVQAFCCSDLKEKKKKRQKRKLLFHLVCFEEEAAARDQGCPPVLCVTHRVCVRPCVCVCLEQEEKRERERYEGKTDRTRRAGDSRFWTRFEDTSCPSARSARGKNINQNLLCIISAVLYSHRATDLISELFCFLASPSCAAEGRTSGL